MDMTKFVRRWPLAFIFAAFFFSPAGYASSPLPSPAPIVDLPPAVAKTVHMYMDSSNVVETQKISRGHENMYFVTLENGKGSEVQLTIMPNGKLIRFKRRCRWFEGKCLSM